MRTLAAAILFLLAALASRAVLAHDGHPHASPSPAASVADAALKPSCPSPIHACGCGNLALCEPASRPAVAYADIGVLAVAPRRAQEGPVALALLPSCAAPLCHHHRLRAPPFLL
jgi:hypothetical protein